MRLIVRCVECGAPWDAEHCNGDWEVFYTAAQPPQPLAYCPGCAAAKQRPGTLESNAMRLRSARVRPG